MSDDELVPFAESIGVRRPDGQPVELTAGQRGLLEGLHHARQVDPLELVLAARKTARHQAAARALVVAALEGADLRIAASSSDAARSILRRAEDELELAARVLGLDVVDVDEARRRLRRSIE